MSGAYFHQDLLVARWVYENRPIRHLDIGSRTDGFIAHVAVFREVEMLDIRDIQSNVKNIVFKRADLMQLPEELVGRFDSVSSLHAIEHFGLGRYGDPIDANGHLKALDNIHQLLQPGGVFYFSTPIGPLRVEFNAHRVFSVSYLLDAFKGKFSIESFAYVDDQGDLHTDCSLTASHEVESNFGCTYGCGIFVLRKIA
jgi:SAM-dependent methyltransferase